MSLDQRKINIINYILRHMSRHDFDRGERSLGFDNYNQFIQFQQNKVVNLKEGEVKGLEFLINQIVPIASIMDKESMIDWDASGLAFNSDGEIVLYHER